VLVSPGRIFPRLQERRRFLLSEPPAAVALRQRRLLTIPRLVLCSVTGIPALLSSLRFRISRQTPYRHRWKRAGSSSRRRLAYWTATIPSSARRQRMLCSGICRTTALDSAGKLVTPGVSTTTNALVRTPDHSSFKLLVSKRSGSCRDLPTCPFSFPHCNGHDRASGDLLDLCSPCQALARTGPRPRIESFGERLSFTATCASIITSRTRAQALTRARWHDCAAHLASRGFKRNSNRETRIDLAVVLPSYTCTLQNAHNIGATSSIPRLAGLALRWKTYVSLLV
jgi:hypothetical protein